VDATKHERLLRELVDHVRRLEPGERLPSERELSERHGVARQTLRRAVDELERDGYVVRRHGSGTYVVQPRHPHRFRVQSFTEDMRARRLVASSEVLGHEVVAAGGRLGAALRISPADRVLNVRRLRLADGVPMALEDMSVRFDVVERLDPKVLATRSFYELLRVDFGVDITGGTQTLEATVTDPEQSALLRVPALSPALQVERVIWDDGERPIEATRTVYRGDRYQFVLNLEVGPMLV
jgi:GntR family transcriptional regulator